MLCRELIWGRGGLWIPMSYMTTAVQWVLAFVSWGMTPWRLLLKPINWHPLFKSNQCSSLENRAPISFIASPECVKLPTECSAVLLYQGQFLSQIFTKHPKGSACDSYSASVPKIINAISYYIGPRFNGNALYLVRTLSKHDYIDAVALAVIDNLRLVDSGFPWWSF